MTTRDVEKGHNSFPKRQPEDASIRNFLYGTTATSLSEHSTRRPSGLESAQPGLHIFCCEGCEVRACMASVAQRHAVPVRLNRRLLICAKVLPVGGPSAIAPNPTTSVSCTHDLSLDAYGILPSSLIDAVVTVWAEHAFCNTGDSCHAVLCDPEKKARNLSVVFGEIFRNVYWREKLCRRTSKSVRWMAS